MTVFEVNKILTLGFIYDQGGTIDCNLRTLLYRVSTFETLRKATRENHKCSLETRDHIYSSVPAIYVAVLESRSNNGRNNEIRAHPETHFPSCISPFRC